MAMAHEVFQVVDTNLGCVIPHFLRMGQFKTSVNEDLLEV